MSSDLSLSIGIKTRTAVQVVSEVAGVVAPDILARARGTIEAALAREVAIYLVHCVGETDQETTALAFRRDRSTVANAVAVIEDLRDLHEFDILIGSLEDRFGAFVKAAEARLPASAWEDAISAVSQALDQGVFEGRAVGVALRTEQALAVRRKRQQREARLKEQAEKAEARRPEQRREMTRRIVSQAQARRKDGADA